MSAKKYIMILIAAAYMSSPAVSTSALFIPGADNAGDSSVVSECSDKDPDGSEEGENEK